MRLRKFWLTLAAASLLGILFAYNNCSQTSFTTVYGGVGVGNPMTPVSNQLISAVCSVINRCNPQVSLNTCQASLLSVSGFDGPLGLNSNYSTLASIMAGEQSGGLVGSSSFGGSCYQNVTSLSCSSAVVQAAYVATAANPFSGAATMLNGASCNQSFTPSSQYTCSTKVFLTGVANSSLSLSASSSGVTYTISPPLPAGLSIDSHTGIISGTPTSTTPMTAYTVIAASTLGGTSSSTVNIRTTPGFLVNDLGDGDDANPGDGVCATSGGTCTLRAAVDEINSSAAKSVIVLPPGDIKLSSKITLNKPSDIYGDCAQKTGVDGQGATPILDIEAAGAMTFESLMVENGYVQNGATTGNPAGMTINAEFGNQSITIQDSDFLNNVSGNAAAGAVSASSNAGYNINLAVVNSNFQSNQSNGGNAGALYTGGMTTLNITSSDFVGNTAAMGGAVRADGDNTISQSLFSGNKATVSYGGGFYQNSGNTVLLNDTFVGNAAPDGGGIFSAGGTITVKNSTIVSNSASDPVGRAGGVSGATISNSIVALNTDVSGPHNCASVVSNGFNLSDTQASDCGLTATGDLPNSSPILGPLQNNGGATSTLALLTGSPGIDQGNSSTCPSIDQRGLPRLTDGHCDIGAFETQP